MKPKVSVIIITYNGLEYISASVQSILRSKTKDLEIIVVDNGSNDNTPNELQKQFAKRVNVIALDRNYGPAYARNAGVKLARGQYLAFLDNDTLVHPDWAKVAVKYFALNPEVGIIQCKLLLAKDRRRLDYIGEYLGQNGFLVQRVKAGVIDKGQYDQINPILAAKSAGMFIRRSVFRLIGGFDPDYFIYVEETDLGWRSWLAGYQAVFLPTSIVYHEFGTSTIILGKSLNSYNAKFHGCKNYILTLLKNLSPYSLIRILPIHIALWLGLAWFSLLKMNLSAFVNIHMAVLWNVYNLPNTFRKRAKVQRSRKMLDNEIFAILMKKKKFKYFLNKVIKKHKVGNAESF